MIFLTGDTHSNQTGEMKRFNSKNFPEGNVCTKNDYVIILGDFGFVWNQIGFSKHDIHWLSWLNSKPWTTLFLDGNHDNHDRLLSPDEFPEVDFGGDKVKKIWDSVFYLQRGRCYNINDISFFVMGGAPSIDKQYRIPNVSWWPQEEPSFIEWKSCLENARKIRRVDYILAHDAPDSVYKELDYGIKPPNSVSKGLTELTDVLWYKWGFGGHHHIDNEFTKQRWTIIYNKIIRID